MVFPDMWSTYVDGVACTSPLVFYRVTYIAVERIRALLSLPPQARASVPYAGFDLRDIKDFNLENLEEYDLYGSQEEDGPFYMQGATDSSTAVAVWLLLLSQIFRSNSLLIGTDFRAARLSLSRQLRVTRLGDPSDEEEPNMCENFLGMISDLLKMSAKMKEDSYLLTLKVVAAINWLIPTKDLVGSTEVLAIISKSLVRRTDFCVRLHR
jgi:hypothetical protein